MAEEFQTSKPIYYQLAERINRQIVRNELKAGDKLPSVREMAIHSGVNPNTVQRTYRELEGMGIVGQSLNEDEGGLSRIRALPSTNPTDIRLTRCRFQPRGARLAAEPSQVRELERESPRFAARSLHPAKRQPAVLHPLPTPSSQLRRRHGRIRSLLRRP